MIIPIIKICIIADPQIDKKQFLHQLKTRKFTENYKPILGVDLSKDVVIIKNVDGNSLVIFILI